MGTAASRFRRRWWRAGAVVLAVAVLAGVPSVIAALPAADSPVSAASLLARVEASAAISFSGLVQSEGTLALPALPRSGATADLLGGITRLREWWSGSDRWRVDQLQDDGEVDTYAAREGSLTWDSLHDAATLLVGRPSARVPVSLDLTPPSLGRRLADGATGSSLARIGAERIAGQDALGLRITPPAGRTTVGHIDVWSTAQGLPLRVSVVPAGAATAAVTTSFLAVHLGSPPATDTSFVPPPGAHFSATRTPDYVADAEQDARFRFPPRLAGLARNGLVGAAAGPTGVATYGSGYELVGIIPLPSDVAQQAFSSLQPPVGELLALPSRVQAVAPATPVVESLPLFDVVVVRLPGGATMLVAGTVGRPVLRRAVDQLLLHPPAPDFPPVPQ